MYIPIYQKEGATILRKNKLTDRERQKKRLELISSIIICPLVSFYIGLILGAVAYQNPSSSIIDIVSIAIDNPVIVPFPTIPSYIFICLLIAAIIDIYMWEQYLTKAGVVTNPNGDASFEEDYLGYDREFVIDPQIVQSVTNQEPKTYYTNEHKKVVASPKITNKQNKQHQYTDNVYAACWQKHTNLCRQGSPIIKWQVESEKQ